MTSAVPAHRTAPQMTHTPDPATTPQTEAGAAAIDARPARARLRDQIAENRLLSLFGGVMLALLTLQGTVMVALLVFSLTSISDRINSNGERIDGVETSLNARIDGVETSLNARIDGVETSLGARIDRLEDRMDAGFAAQGAQIAELDRKLTALIAALNMKRAVDGALEGRLLDG